MQLKKIGWGAVTLIGAVLVAGCSSAVVKAEPAPPTSHAEPRLLQEPAEQVVVQETVQGSLPEFMKEPRMPPPAYNSDSKWTLLDRTVRDVAADFPGRVSVVAVDLSTEQRYEFRTKDVYYPASTFKLPVTLCVLQAIERGELSWDTLITYTEDDYDSVGGGAFYETTFGTKWPVHNLVRRSLVSSNNIAVMMLARTLGWDNLLSCTTGIGGPVTRTDGGSTPVTVESEVAWWHYLWTLRQAQPKLAEGVIQPLRQSDYRGRIVSATPQHDLVLQKFGSYATNEHAGALVQGDRPYILVVMTHGAGEYAANAAIEQIARAAWETITAGQ